GFAEDVARPQLTFALVLGDLLAALAADALEDRSTHVNGMIESAQANVHEIDSVLRVQGDLQVGEQLLSQVIGADLDQLLARRRIIGDVDKVVHAQLANGGAELAVDARRENRPGAVGAADALDESIDGAGIADFPADVRLDQQNLVDGLAFWIVGQLFDFW